MSDGELHSVVNRAYPRPGLDLDHRATALGCSALFGGQCWPSDWLLPMKETLPRTRMSP
jgi:hypothetical protein